MDAERKTTRCPLENHAAIEEPHSSLLLFNPFIPFEYAGIFGGGRSAVVRFSQTIFSSVLCLALSRCFPHSRMLTFCYLVAFNWWLVLCPSTLSHDWQMGSIPLLTSLSDPRNMLTLWAFLSAILMLHKSVLDFEVNIVVAAHKFVFFGESVASEL